MYTTMLIKVNKELKQKAQKVAKELGLSMSTIINSSMRELVEKKSVTFSLVPNTKTAKILDQRLKDVKDQKNLSPVFSDSKKAIAWLRK